MGTNNIENNKKENIVFSIIVVCLNEEKNILKTLNSVLMQKYQSYEIIVKDGFSKDNTLELIPQNNKIKVYSEKDIGIYDAMNQAIKYSSGRFCIFMNCGDYFYDDEVLAKVSESITDVSEIIYGDYIRKGVVKIQAATITPFYLFRTPLCHQTMFIKRSLFDDFGLYNVKIKIFSDYEFTLACYFGKTKFEHIDKTINDYLGGGVSEAKSNIKIKNKENKIIRKKYFKKSYYLFLLKHKVTFPKLRGYLVCDKSPKWLRAFYAKIVGKINQNL